MVAKIVIARALRETDRTTARIVSVRALKATNRTIVIDQAPTVATTGTRNAGPLSGTMDGIGIVSTMNEIAHARAPTVEITVAKTMTSFGSTNGIASMAADIIVARAPMIEITTTGRNDTGKEIMTKEANTINRSPRS